MILTVFTFEITFVITFELIFSVVMQSISLMLLYMEVDCVSFPLDAVVGTVPFVVPTCFFSFLKSFHVVWDFVLTESDFRFFLLFFVLSNLWCKFLRNRYSDRDDNPLLKGAFWVAKYLTNSILWYFFFLSLPFLGRSNFLHRF